MRKARFQSASGLIFADLLAREHGLGVEADGGREMRGHVAVVTRHHLDPDAEGGEVADDLPGLGLGRVEEEDEPCERHVGFVVVAVVRLRGDPARGHREHAEPFRALFPVVVQEPGAHRRVQRDLTASG